MKIEAAQSFPKFFIDLYQFLSVDIDLCLTLLIFYLRIARNS